METGALKAYARRSILCAAAAALACAATAGLATDRDGKRVVIPKSGERCINDPKCHNRWHYAIPRVASADPGDVVVFGTRDAFDHSLDRNSTAADVAALNLNLVHPLTGPLHVRGAKAGDVLAVTLLDVEPDDFGYTIVVPGFGFLRDVFTEPFIVRWDLSRRGATSRDMPGVKIRFDGFMGTIGVAPGPKETETVLQREADLAAAGGVRPPSAAARCFAGGRLRTDGSHRDRCLRTIAPRENGGNMDVKQMQVGTTLLPALLRRRMPPVDRRRALSRKATAKSPVGASLISQTGLNAQGARDRRRRHRSEPATAHAADSRVGTARRVQGRELIAGSGSAGALTAALRRPRTSRQVMASSATVIARRIPVSMSWKAQNRSAGW